MELEKSLKALDNKTLQVMSLKDLEAKIHEGILTNASRSELFDILMRWLNEQIKQDVITQDHHLLESFVDLLHMHSHVHIDPFHLTQVDEVFKGWLKKDTIENPAYRRRYLITQQDVHLLFSNQHFRKTGARPLFDCRQAEEQSHSPSPLCERKDNHVRVEKESADLRQDIGQDTPSRATQHSDFPIKADIIETDNLGHFNKPPTADAILSQYPNDSQDADTDDPTTTLQETIVVNSSPDAEMRRAATRANRRGRGRRYKVHDDLDLSTPPRNYICRRCQEPGHWIQHCPTNLNPHFDQAPANDYRCNFCGQKGNHFATLCSKNPHEGSLTKQREHAITETREFRTPTRSSRSHHYSREPSETRLRDRNRSRSPERRSWDRFRSRTPEYHYDSQTQHEDERRRWRHMDELDMSPYTARVRLTRELRTSLDNAKERGSSSRSWDDPFRFGRRSSTPPPLYRYRSPRVSKPRKHRDLDRVTNTDEGRLAYDDESEIPPKSSSFSPKTSHQQHTNANSISGEEVISSALSSMAVAPDDYSQVELEAENFLCDLAADIMSKNRSISQCTEANTCENESEDGGGHAMQDCMEGNGCSDMAIELESPPIETTPDPKYQLVQSPPFRPEIVFLFRTRENPIINSRVNRKTASQMMERSENFRRVAMSGHTGLPPFTGPSLLMSE